MKKILCFISFILLCMTWGCEKEKENMPLSNLRSIQYFRLQPYHNEGKFLSVFNGSIDETNKRITLTLPASLDLSSLRPQIILSPWATVSPGNLEPVDFGGPDPVEYTVTSESGKVSVYEVVVNPTYKYSGVTMLGVWADNIQDPATGMPVRSTFSSSTGRSYDIRLPAGSLYNSLELRFENDPNSFYYTMSMSHLGADGPFVPFSNPVDFSQNAQRRMWFKIVSESGSQTTVYQLRVMVQ